MTTTSITTMKICGKCKTAPAVLTLATNGGGEWHYCAPCTKASIYGYAPHYDGGSLAYLVRYVYPFGGVPRAHLPADALALCRS